MNNIVVNVKGSLIRNGQTEETEFLTRGNIKMMNGKKILSYSGASGEDDFTEITLDHDAVILKKQESDAQDTAVIVLEDGKVYSSFYHTPLGIVTVQVYPTLIHLSETDMQGEIELEYITNIADIQTINRLQLIYGKHC